jgi:TolB-like protein
LKNLINSTCRILFLSFIFIIFANINLFADEPDKVAIIPFKMNAQNDLTFLQNGIYDMLASRLSRADRVQIVGREETDKALEAITGPINEGAARQTGEKLNADFVLFGSLTVFGNSVSIDAKMVDVSGKKPTLAFFNQSQGMDEVIGRINIIARDINEKIFGIKTAVATPPPASSAPATESPERDIHAHPETLLKGEVTGEEMPLQGRQNSLFVEDGRAREISSKFWKSHNFKSFLNGLALGDVDKDGKVETVVAGARSIRIYRYENRRLIKLEEINESKYLYFIGVDIADINQNGYPEIFVTSLNSGKNSVSSFVLEYNGRKYVKIIDDVPWYFRVVKMPDKRPVLLGQKNTGGGPFAAGAIHEMTWENSEYIPSLQVLKAGQVSVMGATMGDAMNSGDDHVLAYTKRDRLKIFSAGGGKEWTGSDRLGGSTLYYQLPKVDPGTENKQYLPMRVAICDMNKDGKNEVIAVKNQEMAGSLFKDFRKFEKANFVSLSWDGLGLVLNWKTRTISGHIRDFAIGDFDNDGKDELVAGVIIKEGSIVLTSPKSTIVAYEIGK